MRQVIRYSILLCFGIALRINTAYAHNDSVSHPYLPVVLSDTKRFFEDAGMFFTSPLRFSGKDWLITGGIAGGAAGLSLLDENMRSLSQRNQSLLTDDISEISRIYGENYFGAGLSAGIYGVGLFTKNKELRETGLLVFESLAFSAAITHSLKIIVGRSRPYTENGSSDFSLFSFHEDRVSLPSGHATAAFAISSVLSERIGNTYVSIGLYTLATCTALSRVYGDVHWLSDVALGSAIGYVTGNAVLNLHETQSSTGFEMLPTLRGIAVVYRF